LYHHQLLLFGFLENISRQQTSARTLRETVEEEKIGEDENDHASQIAPRTQLNTILLAPECQFSSHVVQRNFIWEFELLPDISFQMGA